MFTITNSKNPSDIHTADTLEGLRAALVNEAIKYDRADAMTADWEDQFCAVHPYDESELDEGETNPTPRPLTTELLEALAARIWDTYPEDVRVTESKITAEITGQREEVEQSVNPFESGKNHIPLGEFVHVPALDIVTIYCDGEEVDEVEVESSEDAEPYDAAIREAGYSNFTWV